MSHLYNNILTFKVPPQRPPRELPPLTRARRAKVLLVTSSHFELQHRFGIDWKRVIQPGLIITETKKNKSKKQAALEFKKFEKNNLVVYCHQEDIHAFVIAVGITTGCTMHEDLTVCGQWEVLGTGHSWARPLDSNVFEWSSETDHLSLKKTLCRPYTFAYPLPKFWAVHESLMRSMNLKTNTDKKRLVIFVQKAFEVSQKSWDVFQKASQQM